MADDRLSPVQIRTARADDLPALLSLLEQLRDRATLGVAWGRADHETAAGVWAEILEDARRTFLVALMGGEVVGTADLIVVPNLTHSARPVAFVENVVVDVDRRSRGIGRALMSACEARAVEAGCYKLQLLSNRGRTDAHRFYESLGFEPAAQGYRRYLE